MTDAQERKEKADAKLIAIIAGAIAIGASAKATAASLAKVIGIPIEALLPVLILAMSKPISYGIATLPSASASSEASGMEAVYRAHYVLAASRRVQQAMHEGKSVADAMRAEKPYFQQHMNAVQNRHRAAIDVDKMARRYGDQLGWHAILDQRTSTECRQANGTNFSAATRPAIGYPGSVHPHCRCKPGKAFATSKTAYSVMPERRAA